jgi:hypothetical protein
LKCAEVNAKIQSVTHLSSPDGYAAAQPHIHRRFEGSPELDWPIRDELE